MYPKVKDPAKCQEIVETAGMRMSYHQCSKPLFKDGFCRIHHPDAVRKRQEKSRLKWEEYLENSPHAKLRKCQDELSASKAEVERLSETLKFIYDECDWESGTGFQGSSGGDDRIGPAIMKALKTGGDK